MPSNSTLEKPVTITTPNFKAGDKVYVKAKFFRTTQLTKKLAEKYLGPYEIIVRATAEPNLIRF